MTFTEAAAEVLRLAGKPLHFKDITQMAIERNLLSHVGKTPDVTMGARLSLQIKKEPDGPLVRVKPGIFALREWESGSGRKKKKKGEPVEVHVEAPVEPATLEEEDAAADRFAALASQVEAAEEAARRTNEPKMSARAAAAEAFHQARTEAESSKNSSRAEGDEGASHASHRGAGEVSQARHSEGAQHARPAAEPAQPTLPLDEEDSAPLDEDEKIRGQLAAGATDLFEEEDDDDQPLFGGPEPTTPAQGEGGRRRRRRRRRGKGRDEQQPALQGLQPAGSAGFQAGASGAQGFARGSDDDEEETIGVTIGDERDEQPTRRAIVLERVPAPQAQGRNRGQDFRAPAPPRSNPQPSAPAFQPPSQDLASSAAFEGTDPIDDLAGRELADLIHNVLLGADRGQGLVGLRSIAEAAQRRGRLAGDLTFATSAIAAAMRGDNLRRASLGQRARFRFAQGGRVAPTDWSMSPELLRAEQEVFASLERYREAARRVLANRLQKDMSGPALVELLLTLLERMGFQDVRPVRRPGLPGGESHFSALHVMHGEEIRTAIVLRRDGREIGRERVIDLRGSLHHYGPASAGWLITTGQCLSGAREEALAPGTIPIALYDHLGFARLLEEHDVAVLNTRISLPLPDIELLEALRGI